jgi:1-acyl-sn-glycerol-3-phosphate acyltransferase
MFLQKYVAKFVLSSLGWKPLKDDVRRIIKDSKRIVLVFPHTSYMDFVIMFLYKKANPELMKNIKFLMNPAFLDKPILGPFLMSQGAIPSTPREKKNGGKTQHIINYLNNLKEYQFLISPKGTINKGEWRSGYFYITEGTKSLITVAGLDFKKGEVVVTPPQNIDVPLMDRENLEVWLKSKMKSISQRYPKNVEY